jgi:hypothetical protein
MKNLLVCFVAAVMGFVCLVSCSGQESDLSSVVPSSNHQLRVVTHTREGEVPVTPLANIYLFKGNAFVRTLQTDADNSYSSAAVKLPEGAYTLCALNASGLSHFLIPENPTPTSVITKAMDQTMGDLLMATASVSLPDGTDKEVNMTLERKVLELSSFSVSQVPADVTAVTVAIAPFSSGIQFNGTYVKTDPVTCTFSLVASTATTGLWQLSPRQFVFPSIGIPTITVTFSRGENDATTYTYTAESALTANNKYDIAGTYTEPLGVTLSGTVTAQSWADPTAVNFDFDEQNANNNTPTNPATDPSEVPVAGQTYKGCYVVFVDEANRTAVLLSPEEKNGYLGNTTSLSGSLPLLNSSLSTWSTISGLTGSWRIPTIEEIRIFAGPSNILDEINTSNSKYYYCYMNSDLKTVQIVKLGDHNAKVKDPGDTNGNNIYLRPVIDITY